MVCHFFAPAAYIRLGVVALVGPMSRMKNLISFETCWRHLFYPIKLSVICRATAHSNMWFLDQNVLAFLDDFMFGGRVRDIGNDDASNIHPPQGPPQGCDWIEDWFRWGNDLNAIMLVLVDVKRVMIICLAVYTSFGG